MIGSSVANADLLVRASGLWARKAIGSSGQLLKVVTGAPTWSTSGGGAGGVGLYAQSRVNTAVTASSATTGTTYQDILLAALDPGTYRFEIKNFCVNNATPDMKTRLHFTGTATEVKYHITSIITGNSNYFNGQEETFDVAFVLTSTAQHTCTHRGTLKVTATGNLSWQAAQNASSATVITLAEVGGYMNVWQLG
jgi:hypothetical protein